MHHIFSRSGSVFQFEGMINQVQSPTNTSPSRQSSTSGQSNALYIWSPVEQLVTCRMLLWLLFVFLCQCDLQIPTVVLCYLWQNNILTSNCWLAFTKNKTWETTWPFGNTKVRWCLIHLVCYINFPFPLILVDNENGLDYDDEQSPSSPTNKSLPRSVSGTTVSSQGTQSGKSKKPFFKKVPSL